jgi:thiamine biosynthesis lipoprotein
MGTAVLFDVRGAHFPQNALDEAVALLHWVDATFSVHRHDSEISQISRGELVPADADPRVGEVLAACDAVRRRTNGAFDHRPNGDLDPSGYVKGWAVEAAADVFTGHEVTSFLISAGGDIIARGAPEGADGWRVGIHDPNSPGSTVGTVDLRDNAVATSGQYERGRHIWGIAGKNEELASVSIVGPDLGIADALATAVFAAGLWDAGWLADFPDYAFIAVTSDARIFRSPAAPFVGSETR